jgi:rod shape-determining protein MreD
MRRQRSAINRRPSVTKFNAVPILSVMMGSMVSALPILADYPILPPLGLMFFLCWRLLHPGLWPLWAGFPFGLFDDIFSGQPFGSAIVLWSLIMIALEIFDQRLVQRGHAQNWLIAAAAMFFALIMGAIFVGFRLDGELFRLIGAQFLLAVALYPFVTRLTAALDFWRTQ